VSAIPISTVQDHERGPEDDADDGLEDPVAFLISATSILLTTAIVFGVVVPRTKAEPGRAATRGFVLSLISVLDIVLIWLGVTFVVAGGAIALGLLGRRGKSRPTVSRHSSSARSSWE
jgi:hypothetical protein